MDTVASIMVAGNQVALCVPRRLLRGPLNTCTRFGNCYSRKSSSLEWLGSYYFHPMEYRGMNIQSMQSRDSCVQRETSFSITLLPTGTIKVQVKSCAW